MAIIKRQATSFGKTLAEGISMMTIEELMNATQIEESGGMA